MNEYIALGVITLCLVPLLIHMAPSFIHIDWERKDGTHFRFGEPPKSDPESWETLFSFRWPRKKPPEGK